MAPEILYGVILFDGVVELVVFSIGIYANQDIFHDGLGLGFMGSRVQGVRAYFGLGLGTGLQPFLSSVPKLNPLPKLVVFREVTPR